MGDNDPFADPSVQRAAQASSGGDEAPSWLRGSQATVPPPPPPAARAPQVVSGNQATGAEWANNPGAPPAAETEAKIRADAAREAKVPQLLIYSRLINVGMCILLGFTGIMSLITFQGISQAVLACYLLAFSCILCCFETHLKFIAKLIAANFGFLYNAKGRAIFLLFIGLLCLSFRTPLGYISAAGMIANAGFNFYAIYKYPEFEQRQHRRDLEDDAKDMLKANQGAIASGAAQLARDNPEQAAKAARSAAAYV